MAIACVTLVLLGCQRHTPASLPITVHGAHDAVDSPEALSHEHLAAFSSFPSSTFGAYVSVFLAHSTTFSYNTALVGVEAQSTLLYGGQQQDQSMEIIENLGSALQVNVFDLLNRSTDRERALTEYQQALDRLLQAATNDIAALKDQQKSINNERSDGRRHSGDIQHDLNKALREKDYADASIKQEELTETDKKLGDVDARSRRVQSLIDILSDLVKVGEKRSAAMAANRAIFIAGLKVINVPGIEDVGILQTSSRRHVPGRTNSLIDPGPGFGQ